MERVYSLHNDPEQLSHLQRSSREPGSPGLKATHGPVGSPDWWRQLEEGYLKAQTISGAIDGFWPGQWGDGPAEFRVLQADGTSSTWLCEMAPEEARRVFTLARPVEVDYVVQELKTPQAGKTHTQLCLAIRVGEAPRSPR